ncbi:carph-isopro domain-containing protein [Komagataeibacter medellinensis]|uniref:carph-isopro domain-containing protein n=1 Tax=Komagataeibacter medellinensis TaxID=1177712 RepID=UPI0009DB2F3F
MSTREIIRRAGGVTKVASILGLHHSTVSLWVRRGVPAKYAVDIAAMAGLQPADVCPDVFRDPLPQATQADGAAA